jgi:IclR family acetate operon transcriptional repressor
MYEVAAQTSRSREGETETNADLRRYEIAVVGNALDLITTLSTERTISTATAARLLGISRSTAYRILITLATHNFVTYDRSTRVWSIGPELARTLPVVTETQLHSIASPSMRRLLAEEQETVNLAVFANNEITYAHILESPLPFRMSNIPGEKAPMHATALGKAILAAHPEKDWPRLVSGLALESITENTITDPDDLLTDLAVIRERGWAEDRGETSLGVVCFGAAIRGPSGTPLGGLSISVPEVRLGPERATRLGNRVVEETGKISTEIGFSNH